MIWLRRGKLGRRGGGVLAEKWKFRKTEGVGFCKTDGGFREFLRQRGSFAKPPMAAKQRPGLREAKRVSQNRAGLFYLFFAFAKVRWGGGLAESKVVSRKLAHLIFTSRRRLSESRDRISQ